MSDNKSRISELKKVLGSVSSSDLCGCSVCVHENPLLDDLFIDGRLRSDLEFALVDKDAQALNAIVQSERSPRFSEVAFPRHMSPADYSEVVESTSASMDALVNSDSPASAPSEPAPAPSETASASDSSAAPATV